MENEELYRKARRKVKAKKGFLFHLIAYVGVLGMLYSIMYFENGGDIVPVIVVGLSWGIGLASHYLATFGTEHLDFLGFNSNWEEDELEKELEKLKWKRELREEIQKEQELLDESEILELREIEKRPLDDDFA